jgi:hypothetical protein
LVWKVGDNLVRLPEASLLVIPIVWTEYTATVNGRVLKLVPCEYCTTEYVYVLERESKGTARCPYSVLSEDGQARLVSCAEESLQQYLANDFDPVPCPVCGNYQRFMFPKLMQAGCLSMVATAVVLLAGGLSVVGVMLQAVDYLDRPSDQALWRLAGAFAVLAVIGLIGAGLWATRRAQVRKFDPNAKNKQARIALGRSRAVTRVEFESGHRPTH